MDKSKLEQRIDHYVLTIGDFTRLDIGSKTIERQMSGDLKDIENMCGIHGLNYADMRSYYLKGCSKYYTRQEDQPE